MSEEIKIRIQNHKQIEQHLLALGFTFDKELNATDTYFLQPPRKVLKITEDERGIFLVKIVKKKGTFVIEEYSLLKNVRIEKENLEKTFGIKCILKKKRRFFLFNNLSININLIENLGEFLIIQGNNLNKDEIMKRLNILNPKFITVSFDELIRK